MTCAASSSILIHTMKNIFLPIFALSATALVACTTVSSADLRSTGIEQDFTLIANDAQDVAISVTFRNGANFIRLESGDNITCEGQGLDRTESAGTVTYSKKFARKGANETYSCSLTRSGESPYVTTLRVPAAFNVAGIGDTFDPTKENTLTFDRTEGEIRWRVEIDGTNCADGISFQSGSGNATVGNAVIPANSVKVKADQAATGCGGKVQITREIANYGTGPATGLKSTRIVAKSVSEKTLLIKGPAPAAM
jgi:hypothetical protein